MNIIKSYYRPGDRIRGILVNSHIGSKKGRMIVGKLSRIEINRRNHTIRVFVKDPETLKVQEIYVDTMERLYESSNMALNFLEFINS